MSMTQEKNIKETKWGEEAPNTKDFLIVIAVILILIVLSWFAYFKFGWLH